MGLPCLPLRKLINNVPRSTSASERTQRHVDAMPWGPCTLSSLPMLRLQRVGVSAGPAATWHISLAKPRSSMVILPPFIRDRN